MELWCGEPIEDYRRIASRYNPKMSDSGCLSDWIEHRGGALPDQYLAAVTLCHGLCQQPDERISNYLIDVEKDLVNIYTKMN